MGCVELCSYLFVGDRLSVAEDVAFAKSKIATIWLTHNTVVEICGLKRSRFPLYFPQPLTSWLFVATNTLYEVDRNNGIFTCTGSSDTHDTSWYATTWCDPKLWKPWIARLWSSCGRCCNYEYYAYFCVHESLCQSCCNENVRVWWL